eukprot:24503-Prymnesium_polylepis.3
MRIPVATRPRLHVTERVSRNSRFSYGRSTASVHVALIPRPHLNLRDAPHGAASEEPRVAATTAAAAAAAAAAGCQFWLLRKGNTVSG